MPEDTVSQLVSMLKSLTHDFGNQSGKLVEIERHQAEKFSDIERKMDLLLAAFPEGGLVQHRIYHESAEARRAERRKLRVGIVTGMLLTLALTSGGFVLGAIWEAIRGLR